MAQPTGPLDINQSTEAMDTLADATTVVRRTSSRLRQREGAGLGPEDMDDDYTDERGSGVSEDEDEDEYGSDDGEEVQQEVAELRDELATDIKQSSSSKKKKKKEEESQINVPCRHTCGCTFQSTVKSPAEVNKNRIKHEETARFHPCMCAGSLGLCDAIDQLVIHLKAEAQERYRRKIQDAEKGYQVLTKRLVRDHVALGTLKPNMKMHIMVEHGLHTLEEYDLDDFDKHRLSRIEHYKMDQHIGWREATQQMLLDEEATAAARRLAALDTVPTTPPVVTPGSGSSTPTSGGGWSQASRRAPSPPAADPHPLPPVTPCVEVTDLKLELDKGLFTPFVFTEQAREQVLQSRSGAAVFSFRPEVQPTQCGQVYKLEHLEAYHAAAATTSKYKMTLTVLGVDRGDTQAEASHTSRERLSEKQCYELAAAAMAKTMQPPKEVVYAKDVEMAVTLRQGHTEVQRVGLPGALWGEAVVGSNEEHKISMMVRQRTVQKRLDLFARICVYQKPHPLNPSLFSVYMTSLLSLLFHDLEEQRHEKVDWRNATDLGRPVVEGNVSRQPTKDELDERVVRGGALDGIQFPGFTSPMAYIKNGDNFFKGHWEQMAAPSFNRADSGGQWWVTVAFNETAKLRPLLEHLLQERYGIALQDGLSPSETALLPTLLLSRELFLTPTLLDKFHIAYSRHYQKPGDVMILQGHCFHQGGVDERYGYSHAEAVNFIDMQWLSAEDGGLRVVYEACRWLAETYVPMWLNDTGLIRSPLRKLLFETYIDNVCHFIPRDWSLHFFQLLLDDLKRWCKLADHKRPAILVYVVGSSSVLTNDDCLIAIQRLQFCIDVLNTSDVAALYTAAVPTRDRAYRDAAVEQQRRLQRSDPVIVRPLPVAGDAPANKSVAGDSLATETRQAPLAAADTTRASSIFTAIPVLPPSNKPVSKRKVPEERQLLEIGASKKSTAARGAPAAGRGALLGGRGALLGGRGGAASGRGLGRGAAQ